MIDFVRTLAHVRGLVHLPYKQEGINIKNKREDGLFLHQCIENNIKIMIEVYSVLHNK